MKKAIVTLLFFSLSVFAPSAFAAGYLGIGIGQSSVDIDLGPQIPGITVTADDSDTAYKIFGGDKVTDNFGWELGWVDFGTYNIYLTDGIDYVSQDTDASAFYLAALGYLPTSEDSSFFGKIGIARWNLDFSLDTSFPLVLVENSDDGTDLMFGLGWQFKILRIEYERYTGIGDPDGEDVDIWNVAAVFSF